MNLGRKDFLLGVAALGVARGDAAAETADDKRLVLSRTLPVDYDVDVFVAGGGPAGVCAAVAASRAGKSVFLAESSGCFGGAGTTAGVPLFATFGDGERLLVKGIGLEIRKRVSMEFPLDSNWTPINAEELKLAYDALMSASKVKYSFFTTLCDVRTDGRRMTHAVLCSKRGLFAVRAKVFVDCTGDGDLVAFGGGRFEKGDAKGAVMPTTLCTLWGGVDFKNRSDWRETERKLAEAVKDGHFSVPDLHITGISPTPGTVPGAGGGNIGHVFGVDPLDERSLTAAMIDARRRMGEFESFYRKYLKGYDNLKLLATAPAMGVRESRRVVCDYMLTVEDFKRRASFPDEVGRYCYAVDIHPSSADPKEIEKFRREFNATYRYRKGESYGIPYRSLVPVSFDNVLVAGRCIGTDRAMQASVRVMPGCFITGEAAGTAAAKAVAAGGEVREVVFRKKEES